MSPDEAQAPSAQDESGATGSPGRVRWLLVGSLAAIGIWCALMGRFGAGIYALMGPFAVGVALLVAAALPAQLREWLRPTRRGVAVGLIVGVGMTLATYPLYALACAVYPGLRVDVAVLYGAAREASLAEALPWVLAIIVAEELLWRGALLELLAGRVSPVYAMALSVLSYCVAQAGTGSLIVTLLALVCGTLWTLQRHLTRSLLSPLIAHLIWTPTVILFVPVNAPPPSSMPAAGAPGPHFANRLQLAGSSYAGRETPQISRQTAAHPATIVQVAALSALTSSHFERLPAGARERRPVGQTSLQCCGFAAASE
jgi:membrane protease YdiL (CAAX protease family)